MTVHKYGVEELQGAVLQDEDGFAIAGSGNNNTDLNEWGTKDLLTLSVSSKVKGKRSYWTMGAFEEGCSCSDHFMGGSFPAEHGDGLHYEVDMPVVDELNNN